MSIQKSSSSILLHSTPLLSPATTRLYQECGLFFWKAITNIEWGMGLREVKMLQSFLFLLIYNYLFKNKCFLCCCEHLVNFHISEKVYSNNLGQLFHCFYARTNLGVPPTIPHSSHFKYYFSALISLKNFEPFGFWPIFPSLNTLLAASMGTPFHCSVDSLPLIIL